MPDELVQIDNSVQSAVIDLVVKHQGDWGHMEPAMHGQVIASLCSHLGLNPLTKPFELVKLQGRIVLYATKSCTEQLSRSMRLTTELTQPPTVQGDYIVAVARVTGPNGRYAEASGVVPRSKGNDGANALMKAETKACRRAVLRYGGLGVLDESEMDTMTPHATAVNRPRTQDLIEGEAVNIKVAEADGQDQAHDAKRDFIRAASKYLRRRLQLEPEVALPKSAWQTIADEVGCETAEELGAMSEQELANWARHYQTVNDAAADE